MHNKIVGVWQAAFAVQEGEVQCVFSQCFVVPLNDIDRFRLLLLIDYVDLLSC